MKGAERDNVILVPELNWTSYDEYRSNPNPEHRVWYVAATRAKESLHILNSNSLSHHYAYPSRFWLEDREKARHALLEAVAEEVAAAVQAAVLRFDSSKLFDGENLADDLISERRSSV